ncbi:MAG TPA: hypothetical protein VHY76_13535, partial [Acetobacteraceae bacterium]|nr:hypothetical protein [Acetobacteraceae bacterium]
MAHDPAFSTSYRSVRRSRGLDGATRRLLAIAGGIAVAFVAVVGGWSLLNSGGPHAVPVVAAPSGPVRVKPANPGGMQVAGAHQNLMASGTGPDTVTMQSAPEQPALGALHALEAAKSPAASAPTPAAPTPAAPSPAAPGPAAPGPATPAAPALAAVTPAASAPAAPAPAQAAPAASAPAQAAMAPAAASAAPAV